MEVSPCEEREALNLVDRWMDGWEWIGECRKNNQAVRGAVNKCSVSQRCVQRSPESVVAAVDIPLRDPAGSECPHQS